MQIPEHRTQLLDLAIIGGGPAGMSAALISGRALLDAVIVNAEAPRNSVTGTSHGFLTRDGVHPTELLTIAKEQLTTYDTVSYVNDTVASAKRTLDGFEITLSDATVRRAKRLIIATGHTDDVGQLELSGIEDVYGKSVYPCVFCDGFEHRGERLAVFGREGATQYAPMIRLWTNDLSVFTNGADLDAGAAEDLERHGVSVHTGPIQHLDSRNGRLFAVELESGERIEADAGFISEEYSKPTTTFAEGLGVTSSPTDWGTTALDVDDFGVTNIDGLYVVGDARTGFSGLIAAAAEGAACAEAIVHEIAAERWRKR
jgi:thioredoxin reductase